MSSYFKSFLFEDGKNKCFFNMTKRGKVIRNDGFGINYDCYWKNLEDENSFPTFQSEENFKILFNDVDHNGYNSDYAGNSYHDETLKYEKKLFDRRRRKMNRIHKKSSKLPKSFKNFSLNTTLK